MPTFGPALAGLTSSVPMAVAVDPRGRVTLRPLGDDGLPTSDGLYPATVIVGFPAFAVPACRELFGFCPDEEIPVDGDGAPLATVRWRIASDWHLDSHGAPVRTAYYWNGTLWAEATTAEHFCTAQALDLHLATLPVDSRRSFALEARYDVLGDRIAAPAVADVGLQMELRTYDYEEARASLGAHLEQHLSARLWLEHELAEAATSLELAPLTRFQVASVQAVYNLTSDAHRGANVYAGVQNGRVLFGASQPKGSVLRIEYRGRPKILLGGEAEFYASELPCVFVTPPTVNDELEQGCNGRRLEEGAPWRDTARCRPEGELLRLRFHLMAKARRQTDADNLAAGLRDLLQRRGEGASRPPALVFEPTGEDMPLWLYEAYQPVPADAKGLHVRRADALVQFRQHRADYTVVPRVKELSLEFTTGRVKVSSLTVK